MTALIRAVEEGYVEVAVLLLDHGTDPNHGRAEDGLTPLITALVKKNSPLIELLLDKGADANKV
jgi:ankyrin repeat protein